MVLTDFAVWYQAYPEWDVEVWTHHQYVIYLWRAKEEPTVCSNTCWCHRFVSLWELRWSMTKPLVLGQQYLYLFWKKNHKTFIFSKNKIYRRDMVRRNILGHLTKSFSQWDDQTQEMEWTLFNYHNINTSQRLHKVFSNHAQFWENWINYTFMAIFFFSSRRSYAHPVSEKWFYTFVSTHFNNEKVLFPKKIMLN